MPDKEKIIKGLECCSKTDMCCMEINCYHPSYLECPFHEMENCVTNLTQHALTMLKSQQAEIEQMKGYINGFSKDAIIPVRCKECVWWGTDGMCENSDSPCFQNGCTHGDWFCADGERKSDDA